MKGYAVAGDVLPAEYEQRESNNSTGAELSKVQFADRCLSNLATGNLERASGDSKKRSTGPWKPFEEDRAISHMLDLRDEGHLNGDARFKEVSKRLNAEGIRRDYTSFKNYWRFKGRTKTGYDERFKKAAGSLRTSTQGFNHGGSERGASVTERFVVTGRGSPAESEEESNSPNIADLSIIQSADRLLPYPAPVHPLKASRNEERGPKGLWRLSRKIEPLTTCWMFGMKTCLLATHVFGKSRSDSMRRASIEDSSR
jgi:hypothetical protein